MDNEASGAIGNVNIEAGKLYSVILIIDPYESSGNVLKRRLSIYGHDVLLTNTAKTSLEILEKSKIDVIFLDFNTQDINGYDFLKQLKADRRFVNIPVVMISSDNDVEKIVQCIEAGAEDYLIRPFNPTILKARLTNAIDKKNAYDKEINRIAEMKEKQRQIIAQEKMTSLGNMAVAVSQELKNPLNLVSNLSSIGCDLCREISEILPNDTPENLHKLLNMLSDNTQKIFEHSKKLSKILHFIIDQSQASKAEFYMAGLNKIVQEATQMIISDYKEAGKNISAKISLKLDNKIPKLLYLSPQALNQALYNIIDNSIYALNTKEPAENKPVIRISTRDLDDCVEITIYDNGTGIEVGLTRIIFEPFFSTKPDGKGQGLGLSAVGEAVVQGHKGSIKVKSEVSKYSEFIITIPKITNVG